MGLETGTRCKRGVGKTILSCSRSWPRACVGWLECSSIRIVARWLNVLHFWSWPHQCPGFSALEWQYVWSADGAEDVTLNYIHLVKYVLLLLYLLWLICGEDRIFRHWFILFLCVSREAFSNDHFHLSRTQRGVLWLYPFLRLNLFQLFICADVNHSYSHKGTLFGHIKE